MRRFLVGVDEAGRAPLAGPVSVGFVAVEEGFDVMHAFPGLRDSKKLTPEKRDELYGLLEEFSRKGDVRFCVRFSSAEYIDERGITKAVARAIEQGVRALMPEPRGVRVLLDGLLHAPKEYRQQTIIGGDNLVPIISLASIAAKVRRDRLMKRLARQFPGYGFEIHKGYPTKMHYEALKNLGISEAHRRTYCSSLF